VRRDDKDTITLSFVQISKQTFIEIQRATGRRDRGDALRRSSCPTSSARSRIFVHEGCEVTEPPQARAAGGFTLRERNRILQA
jgi:hypothetical protein